MAVKKQARNKNSTLAKKQPKLGEFEAQVAKELEGDRKKAKTSKRVVGARKTTGGRRNANREVKTERKRKSVPRPKNKTSDEIKQMDPDDPQFKHPRMGPERKEHVTTEDTSKLSLQELVRREKQRSSNATRARARKAEAVAAAKAEEIKLARRETVGDELQDDETTLIAAGELELDDWDAQELARGYRRGRNGRFGPPPKYIPREVQQEAFRRLVRRGERVLKEAYLDTIEELINLAANAESEKVRLDALTKIQERLVGKVPDRVHVGADTPWQDMLAESLVPMGDDDPIELELDMETKSFKVIDEPEAV